MTVSPLLKYWGVQNADTIKQIETELVKLSTANKKADMQYYKIAGDNIKTYRLLCGKSAAAFSKELDIYPPLLKMIETGDCSDRPLIDQIGEGCGFRHIGNLYKIYLSLLLGKYELSKNSQNYYMDMFLLSLCTLQPNDTTNAPCLALSQLDKRVVLRCLSPCRSDWNNDAIQIRKDIEKICLQQNYPFSYKIGLNLAFLRQGKNASLETVAEETGLSVSVLEKAESGQEDFTLEQLAALCAYFKVPEPAVMFYNGYALVRLCHDHKLMQKATWAFEFCLYSQKGRRIIYEEHRNCPQS